MVESVISCRAPEFGTDVVRVDLRRLRLTSGNKGEGGKCQTCSLYR